MAATFVFLFQRGYVRFQYPSRSDFPVSGVDVSHHQNEIDWPRLVRESKIGFAFIKATEGTDLIDRRFQENWRGAEGRVARSAYHFFTFCTSGDDQARNLLSTAPDSGELPRAIDVEFGGNCTSWKSLAEVRGELKELVSAVEQKDGRAPILYVTKQSYNRIVRGHFEGIPIWIREVVFRPSAEEYPDLMFWQYAGNGRLKGVDTLVDLNVLSGQRSHLGTWLARANPLNRAFARPSSCR